MENQLTAPVEAEHEQPKSATEVVSDVLHKNTKNNHFLQNVGIKVVRQRRGLHTVEALLEVEKGKTLIFGRLSIASKRKWMIFQGKCRRIRRSRLSWSPNWSFCKVQIEPTKRPDSMPLFGGP
jgi:hypothetical protein